MRNLSVRPDATYQTLAGQTLVSQTLVSQTGANQTGANQTGASQTGATVTYFLRLRPGPERAGLLVSYGGTASAGPTRQVPGPTEGSIPAPCHGEDM